MTFGDLSNAALAILQQPGVNFAVGGGVSGPAWSTLNNPQYNQSTVEFFINEAYKQLMGEIEDLELALVTFTFSSTIQQFKYAVPPSGFAAISHVARIFYQPKGLPYSREFRQGRELVSWAEYTKYTGQNYLLPYAFGTQPWVATIDPLRQNIYFYPGSAIAGDTITVEYTPIPTLSATGCPTLVNAGDTPIIPADCHTGILYLALFYLWVKGRESKLAVDYKQLYIQEIANIRKRYTRRSHGDTFRVEPFIDRLSLDAFGTGVF